ncbi:MAG: aminomethyl-transferring glycine dehydrogenase subunit GcvPA [Planctomycetota bacterium]
MPYIQNTENEQREMLRAIGVESIKDLFEPLPASTRLGRDLDIPVGMDEASLRRHMIELAKKNRPLGDGPSFLGAGRTRHYVPVIVDHLAGRSEFVTAYTPYQPEASQGSLQVFFEFQTMIAQITGMEIANSSVYDGASALAEAALMALSLQKVDRIVVSKASHPEDRDTLRTYLRNLDVELVEVPLKEGRTDLDATRKALEVGASALCFQSPNFLGILEDGAALTEIAHEAKALSIVSVHPLSLGVVAPPGDYDADIVVGDGQPLGCPPYLGGPAFGIFATREKFIRRLPGRIVGQTVDGQGRQGYVLTFQTREQHIRRDKATSNICTNNALMALRGAIYLAAMGERGFAAVAESCLVQAHAAARAITQVEGCSLLYDGQPFFCELAVQLPKKAKEVNRHLAKKGIQGGYDLGRFDPALDHAMLLAVTEVTSGDDVDRLVAALREL